MASNPYDSPLVSGISSSDIKLDPTSFYTSTSFPQSSNNLHSQQLQQSRQQQPHQSQFYSHTASSSYVNLDDSFICLDSPPPLEPDMNSYMGSGGYNNLPLASQYGDYYSTAADGFASQGQIPRSMDYNLMLMSRSISYRSHPASEYHASPIPSPHSSHQGLLIDNEWYGSGRRSSLSRSQSPRSVAHHQASARSIKDEMEGEGTEETKAELPYAKLIHKALMEAPNHAMSLQDIYKWFIENTDKGQSSGSGWRNSIRHNLSMNQVCLILIRP